MMNNDFNRGSALSLLALLFLTLMPALAQVDRASVTGTAFDPTGAVIPGVSIDVRNLDNGFASKTVSAGAGSFTVVGLPPGRYTMSASKDGFRSWKITEFRLSVGDIRKIDVSLGLDTQQAIVEVTDVQAPIDQTSARQGIVVGASELRNIPVNGRDWASYMLLAPGAVDSGGGSQRSIRVMGRSRDDNNFVFDGVDATGVKEGPHLVALRTVISNDAISEFKVTSGMYTAETGFGIGAQVSLVSKSGTNNFHGGLFEYLRNDIFDARRFIDTVSKVPKFRMNQFGGTFGGPVVKDKTHFFTSYEGLRQVLGRTLNGNVPSRAFRTQALTNAALRPIIEFYPLGDTSTSNADIDFVSRVASDDWQENSGMFRVDHKFSDRFTGYVRYNTADGTITQPQSVFLNRTSSFLTTHNAVVQLQQILSTTIVNEFKLGFNRSNQSSSRTGFRESVSIPGFTGIPNLQGSANPGNSYSVIDNFSWTSGRNSIKAGVEVRALQVNISQTDSRSLNYASRPLFLQNRADNIGVVGEFGSRGVRSEVYMGYIQDDYKILPNLTLNIGLRYEFYMPIYEVNGRVKIYADECAGICPPGTDLYNPDFNNFGPRFGFAWTPKLFGGKTTVRGGAGIYHMLGQVDDILGPIESDNVRLSITSRENPNLSYPLDPFLEPGRFLADTPRGLATERKDFEAYQGGLFIVQELPYQFALQVGYAANLGRHLLERNWSNFINPATGTRRFPAFGQIDNKFTGNRSNHHGMQVSLNRRYFNGFLFGAQYMWSKTIDQNGPGSNEGSAPQNPACRACDQAPSLTDVRHNLTLSGSYTLPFGKGQRFLKAGVGSMLLGGWDLSGISTVRSGFPVNVSVTRSAGDVPTGNAQQQRPNLVPGVPVYLPNRSADGWINIAAFSVPARGTFGNLGRNALRGPGLTQIDVALARRIPLTEAFGLQIRAEAFNIANRPQYGNPAANIAAPGNFGRIQSVVNNGATGSGRSRSLQFMIRLDF
jgi:hypothetical protein